MKRYVGILSVLAFALVLMNYSFASADAAKGEAIFKDTKVGNCKTCHDTGDKKKVGPGLKGVTDRQPKEWIEKWLADPQGTWAANDEHAQDLKKRMNKVDKPNTAMKLPTKLAADQIADLIDFLGTLK
ncbi:MAG: cytochrome c [Nitrospinae bacterium]|nr:cytochrome c [Nitrospinota bacterium]